MSQRLIVGLQAGADWHAIRGQLIACGADWIRDPSPEQPDVAVASIPEGSDIEKVLEDIKQLPGVRYAERDAMRWTS